MADFGMGVDERTRIVQRSLRELIGMDSSPVDSVLVPGKPISVRERRGENPYVSCFLLDPTRTEDEIGVFLKTVSTGQRFMPHDEMHTLLLSAEAREGRVRVQGYFEQAIRSPDQIRNALFTCTHVFYDGNRMYAQP